MNSGIRQLEVRDPEGAAPFPAVVQYPTVAPPAGTAIGPYHFDATLDARPAPGRFPVCVISHGGGGSHLLYRSIGTHLAASGYVVVSPEHPGDNASRVCAVGHSMGGYTVLALVGGRPWSRAGQPIPTRADPRVRAAVLLAPSADWFLAPGALADVSVPLLVLAGEQDPVTPPAAIRRALAGLPEGTPVTLDVVPGAGHYAFLTPFPMHMRRPDFPPATDPDGFDRDGFHAELPHRIQTFLTRALGPR